MGNKPRKIKKRSEKQVILEQYIIEKYGSVRKFLDKCDNVPAKGLKRGKMHDMITEEEFLDKVYLGIKICKALEIDHNALFLEERIAELNPEPPPCADPERLTAEEQFLELPPAKQQAVINYINYILSTEPAIPYYEGLECNAD